VALLWEDHLKILVKKQKNKLKTMKGSAMELRGNLVSQCVGRVPRLEATGEPFRVKLREDIVLIVS
jgi:hypothetical protein